MFAVSGEESGRSSKFLQLPDDVFYSILSYLDVKSLCSLSCTCRRFWLLLTHDCVWLQLSRKLTIVGNAVVTNRNKHSRHWSLRKKCRVAANWEKGRCADVVLIRTRVRQMPCFQMDQQHMWISDRNLIKCYVQKVDGTLEQHSAKTLRGHQDDVVRFVCRDDVVVSGGRDGSLCCWEAATGDRLVCHKQAHSSDVSCVDISDDTIISGCRNRTVKIWSLQSFLSMSSGSARRHTLDAGDRVWSLAISPQGNIFVTGTAGCNHVPPLRIWDMENGQLTDILGNQHRNGAGVLDIQFESPHTLLSCGYDTFIRLWDTRSGHCVSQWEEPYDSTVYCMKSDCNYAIVSGTARHGMARLWDKRMTKAVQMYYTGRQSSPVYSLTFDACHLYLGLDKGIHLLDFSGAHPVQRESNTPHEYRI